MLRAFTSESPVYCSLFSDLFPDKSFQFIHLDFVLLLSTFCELKPDIIRDLTIQSLATEFLPDVFSGRLVLGERKHVQWNYPEQGVLSKEWFSRFWKFLQTAAKPEENRTLVIFLGKYPIIPTTDGRLATVDNAKSVLTVIEYQKGNVLQKRVTKILENLACPFLDKSITKDALAVVLPLVADPHCVSDVLHVLGYMNSTGILDMSKFDEEKTNSLLRFFQGDWQNNESMNKAKTLPLYKGVDGLYHPLSSYFSCIQVPAGLPEDGIKELQRIYKNILFLPQSIRLKVNCTRPLALKWTVVYLNFTSLMCYHIFHHSAVNVR